MAIEVKNTNWGSDIQAEAPVSSVGAVVWPPVEASEQRKKGILGRVLETPVSLMDVLGDFESLEFGRTKDDEPITRISGRIFTSRDALEGLVPAERVAFGARVEGMIPLLGAGVPELDDVYMIYLGRNSEERRSNPDTMTAEIAMARNTFQQAKQATSVAYPHYDFHVLDEAERNDPLLQGEYARLYAAFGWNEEDVVGMLTSPTNTLMAAFHNSPGEQRGELASAVIAESAELPVERGGLIYPLHLAEITEAITTPEHRGNGLYTELAIRLMQFLTQTDVNLVYGESNALRVMNPKGEIRQPVLSSVAKLGRRSSIEIMEEQGFEPRLLEQHVRISMGENDTRPQSVKNDLLVTFSSRKDLTAAYGTQY